MKTRTLPVDELNNLQKRIDFLIDKILDDKIIKEDIILELEHLSHDIYFIKS
jgi:hypothetical protein